MTSWLLPELPRVAVERRSAAATMGAVERADTLIVLLADLEEAAGRASQAAARQVQRGHGGARNTPKPVGQLIRDFITVYRELRRDFPTSGRAPAWGGALKRFLHASLDLLNEQGVDDYVLERQWRIRR